MAGERKTEEQRTLTHMQSYFRGQLMTKNKKTIKEHENCKMKIRLAEYGKTRSKGIGVKE